ncbi:MAG: alkaline phosphatase family protein [Trueperaceae bacterium]|nr:MAG: alkaline phosphatase family protein [Trueperaceae bacterium]
MTKRVIIIGTDGLRPDAFDPQLMPCYARLAEQGARYLDFRAAYPPHTRVNMATLTTGVRPGRHGVVGNVMLVPGAGQGDLVDTSRAEHLLEFEARTGRPFLLAPALGDRLERHGRRLGVVASSSPGASLLWNPKRPRQVINPSSHYGQADLMNLLDKLGDVPEERGRTRFERARWATRAMIDLLLPDDAHQVITLWLSEPDNSQHFYGLGSPEAKEALQAVDACVAEVVAALDRLGQRSQTDLLLISDHGHATIETSRSLADLLETAQQELALELPLVAVGDFVYGKQGMDLPVEVLGRLSSWLFEQPWCDRVFAPEALGLTGVEPLEAMIGVIEHDRAPLLAVSASSSSEANAFGVPGMVEAITPYPQLKSSHGSTSRYEMQAFCLAVGPSFPEGVTFDEPCGTVDIAPTVCALLGYVEHGFDGRPLPVA